MKEVHDSPTKCTRKNHLYGDYYHPLNARHIIENLRRLRLIKCTSAEAMEDCTFANLSRNTEVNTEVSTEANSSVVAVPNSYVSLKSVCRKYGFNARTKGLRRWRGIKRNKAAQAFLKGVPLIVCNGNHPVGGDYFDTKDARDIIESLVTLGWLKCTVDTAMQQCTFGRLHRLAEETKVVLSRQVAGGSPVTPFTTGLKIAVLLLEHGVL